MKVGQIFFSIIILLVGAAWIWASRVPDEKTTAGKIPVPRAGFLAPDFILSTTSGETLSLASLRGKPVLLNLWASWCPPCQAEMPAMERVYAEFAARGFTVLAVNVTHQDDPQKALAFANELKLSFPILLDTQGEVSRQYEMRSLPTSFFIDQEGIIQEVIVGGPMSEALLRIRVMALLAEQGAP